jgi:hypothetical protein
MALTVTTKVFQLPVPTLDNNIQALGRQIYDRITGDTNAALPLSQIPVAVTITAYKNGTLLDDQAGTPAWTVSGRTLTLASAPLAADVFQIFYLSSANKS